MISVTEVLDYFCEPEILAWMLREGKTKCQKISQEAMRIGTVVDQCVKADLQGQAMSYDPKDESVVNCIMAWQRFKEDHPLFLSSVTGIQTEVQSGEIVGHPDFEITEDYSKQVGIVDVKTSKAIQPKHWTQVAEYLLLKYPTIDQGAQTIPPVFIGILRLDKATGAYEYKELTDFGLIRYEFEVFQAYLTAYQHGQKIREVIRELAEKECLDVP